MSVLLIGCNGQLGWEIKKRGDKTGIQLIPLDIPDFDITNPDHIKKQVKPGVISFVINAAAYTAVDKAESDQALCFAINSDGPARLAAVCAEKAIPLLHVSTDYVFDGKKDPDAQFYIESDPVSPIGVYAKSKAAGEEAVRSRLTQHIILRTAWLFGVHGQNFVKTMLRLGMEKEEIRVVSDQYGCPTFAGDLAEAILTLLSRYKKDCKIPWGTYHFCGKGQTTWHGFAKEIFNTAKKYQSFKVKKVVAISTKEFPTPARRPLNSTMDCTLIAKTFGIHARPWQVGLQEMIEQIFRG